MDIGEPLHRIACLAGQLRDAGYSLGIRRRRVPQNARDEAAERLLALNRLAAHFVTRHLLDYARLDVLRAHAGKRWIRCTHLLDLDAKGLGSGSALSDSQRAGEEVCGMKQHQGLLVGDVGSEPAWDLRIGGVLLGEQPEGRHPALPGDHLESPALQPPD